MGRRETDGVDTEQKQGQENPESPPGANLSDDDLRGKYLTGFHLWLVFVALALSVFLIGLDFTIVATAIPAITDEFHGIRDVAWYGPAIFLTAAGFTSAWGKVYKYFPLKSSYLVAILIFELGSLICGVAPTSTTLIIGRVIAGVGGAGVASGAYTIVGFISEPKKRPAYTGTMGAAYGLTNALGPIIGGVFSQTTTWKWCFYVNLPVGALSAVVITLFFKNPEYSKSKQHQATFATKAAQMDIVGILLIMRAVISYILAVQYGGQAMPWSSQTLIGLLVATGVILLLFSVWEYFQGERAMYTLFLGGAFFTMVYYLPIYFQSVQGAIPIGSGVRNLPFILGSTLGSITSGLFISFTGLSTPTMLGASAVGAVGCGVCILLDEKTTTGKWVGYQLVAGLALGSGFQLPIIVGEASVDTGDISTVTAMLLFFQTLGGSLFLLPRLAPGVEPEKALSVGAGEIRRILSPQDVPGIVLGHTEGLVVTYSIAAASAGVAFLTNLFLRWKRLDMDALKQATTVGT
ncbi:major facilitator superfamily domain-containing protein [Xylariaceae sp. FL0594]|nr:major facilitator superfamily domain-containing protein [Xylariaceae sp. FL0594]